MKVEKTTIQNHVNSLYSTKKNPLRTIFSQLFNNRLKRLIANI
jgi:hypothetical protein